MNSVFRDGARLACALVCALGATDSQAVPIRSSAPQAAENPALYEPQVPGTATGRLPKGTVAPRNPEAREALDRARRAMADGQLDVASAALTRAMELEPTAYAPMLAAADFALRQNRVAEANQRMKKALALGPDSAEVAAAAGRLAAGQNQLAEAEAQYRRAIRIDPEFVTPYLDMGEMQLALGKAEDAASWFRQAQKADPTHAGAAYGLGTALVAQRNFPAAKAAFELAARLDPANPIPLVAVAEVQSKLGENKGALVTADRAIALDASYLPARLARIDALATAGRHADALKDLDGLIESAGGSVPPGLYFKQGSLLEAMGNLDAAARSYRKAVNVDPKFHPALNNLAWLSATRRKDLDAALAWAKQAVQLDPGSLNYQDTLAVVYLARGDAEAAMATLDQALARDRAQPTLLYRMGQANEAAGRPAQAAASYKAALDTGRPFPEAADARSRLNALGSKPR